MVSQSSSEIAEVVPADSGSSATGATASRRSLRGLVRRAVSTTVLAIISFIILYPLLFVFFTALKSDREIRTAPLAPPQEWIWQNFSEAWTRGNLNIYYKNSIIVVIPVVLVVISAALVASYAFSRLKFRGNRVLYWFFVAGMGLPLISVIIPLFYNMRSWHLLNTHWSVILPMVGILLPFGILLLTGFIDEISTDMLEAAKVDGATDLHIVWHIVIPVTRPGIVTLLVFAFLWTWNQFFLPTIMLTNDSVRTLTVGLSYFIGSYDTDQALLAAGVLITAVPVILVYVVFQRQFIRGITLGSVKA